MAPGWMTSFCSPTSTRTSMCGPKNQATASHPLYEVPPSPELYVSAMPMKWSPCQISRSACSMVASPVSGAITEVRLSSTSASSIRTRGVHGT